MTDLITLIEAEGTRNNVLKDVLEKGKFPSEKVANAIGSAALYEISANTVEFQFRTRLEILKSSHYFVQLIQQYIAECEAGDRIPELDIDGLHSMILDYTKDSEITTNVLVKQFMAGYQAKW